ncbi:MAG: septal ring lytic transglycosylase RlpA family protein [Bacillota bacterium]|nr:septal ring lytic transglycosylase RlpA family protein [Bacillota bacterium]
MKKYWCILLLFLFIYIPAGAAAGGLEVVVDGKILELEHPPVLKYERILLPMREIFTAMGADVYWDEAARTSIAVKNNVRVSIPIGSYLPTVDSVPVSIDVPAMVIGSRTYIPLRFAVESLGGHVIWEANGATVNITTASATAGADGEEQCEWNYNEKIDINSASLENLLQIEGFCESVAGEILNYRDANGFYRTYEEIRNLPSMTDDLYGLLLAKIQISYREEGVACWYGTKFHGRMTSSGEIYDMHLHTAAHRTLPFGTMVLVKFPETGRSVWVRINDRGPHVPGRIIDLSRSAADAIGLTPYGIGWVELEVIRER